MEFELQKTKIIKKSNFVLITMKIIKLNFLEAENKN
jgi:hypothetical protein